MRSAISYTCSRKCETNTTAIPCSLSRRISGRAARPRRWSRLEVGSSRISTSAEMSIARAIATICWTASE